MPNNATIRNTSTNIERFIKEVISQNYHNIYGSYYIPKKSRVIEDILLGIPLTPVLVNLNPSGSGIVGTIETSNGLVESLRQFIENEFRLKMLKQFPFLNGRRFSQMRIEERERILNFPISVTYVSGESNFINRIINGMKGLTVNAKRSSRFGRSYWDRRSGREE